MAKELPMQFILDKTSKLFVAISHYVNNQKLNKICFQSYRIHSVDPQGKCISVPSSSNNTVDRST